MKTEQIKAATEKATRATHRGTRRGTKRSVEELSEGYGAVAAG